MNWIATLTEAERHVVINALLHTVHDLDAPLKEEDLSEIMLDDLDTWINRNVVKGFAIKVPSEARYVLWASMLAAFQDNHMPQYAMSDDQWDLAEQIFNALDRET